MRLHGRIVTGAPRPHWSAPVRETWLAGGPGSPGRLHLSGVVLPLGLPPGSRHGPAGPGELIGFPDLRHHLLHPDRRAGLEEHWDRVEGAIHRAALGLMRWDHPPRPYELHRRDVPTAALHLVMEEPVGVGVEPVLAGRLTRVRPIYDASGSKVRMRPDGARATLRLTPRHMSWSRDPGSL